MLKIILKLISSLFFPQKPQNNFTETDKNDNLSKQNPTIDWTDPNAMISKYFTVHDALFLQSWQIYHIPSEKEKQNILKLAKKMDLLWKKFGKMNIHCWIRPLKVNAPESRYHGSNYNKFVGSSRFSGANSSGWHFGGNAELTSKPTWVD